MHVTIFIYSISLIVNLKSFSVPRLKARPLFHVFLDARTNTMLKLCISLCHTLHREQRNFPAHDRK